MEENANLVIMGKIGRADMSGQEKMMEMENSVKYAMTMRGITDDAR